MVRTGSSWDGAVRNTVAKCTASAAGTALTQVAGAQARSAQK